MASSLPPARAAGSSGEADDGSNRPLTTSGASDGSELAPPPAPGTETNTEAAALPSEPRAQFWVHAFHGSDESKDGEEEGGEEDKPAPADPSQISSFNASLGRGVLEEVAAGRVRAVHDEAASGGANPPPLKHFDVSIFRTYG